jgi:alkane 1-monooxygenase
MSIEIASSGGATIRYTDRKRWLWPLSLLWPLVPALCGVLAMVTQQPAFHWLTLGIWYLALPALDHLLPADPNNPPPEVIAQLDQDRYYRLLTYLTVPMHFITLIVAAWMVATQNLPWHAVLGLALSVGVVNGLAINTGHELGHKNTALERWLARIVLSVCGYGHFYVEHNRGHHKDVATPEDPASSRLGENIYAFALQREIPGALRRAWTTEAEQIGRAHV